ncbi:MAG: DUF4352 domain-containing protein [Lentimicrobiaceae bacterium]|nr:DUF4352 domain-containing protein [Lentimicrobiaceae bacterium]
METLLICLYVAIVIMIAALFAGLIDTTSIYCKSRRQVAAYLGIPLALCFLVSRPISEEVEFDKRKQRFVENYAREITGGTSYNNGNQQASSEMKSKRKEVFPIGQTVRTDYFSYTVRNFSFRKSFGDGRYGFSSTADGIYLIVSISIKNLSDAPCRFPFNDFYVTDKNGGWYTFQDYKTSLFRSDEAGIDDWDFDKFNGTRMFQPNVPTRDCMLFEIPQREVYYLNFRESSTAIILE